MDLAPVRPARTGLRVAVGQHSEAGRKPVNQDFHGASLPGEPLRASKGIALALADGISSSGVSQLASAAAVRSFLDDYYCTSDAWSVKTSALRVLLATNAWLYSQTQASEGRFDKDRGHVCTFSAMVFKSNTAHLFHVGDARIYQVHKRSLEQLTQDHRVSLAPDRSFLGRALGLAGQVEVDYRALPLAVGDTFVLATDGVYEHVSAEALTGLIAAHAHDLDRAAQAIVALALAQGSPDNLTVQVARVEALPDAAADEHRSRLAGLPLPPQLAARSTLDGYRIVRELHASSRSHVYLAVDEGAPPDGHASAQRLAVLKTPAADLQEDAAHLERFMLEEWVARRIDSPYVLKPRPPERPRSALYVVMEYVEGQTLAQWMRDHPRPSLEAVRAIVGQIARGLRAFHRMEMLHQDLRPQNVMLDTTGTARIIDFGSATVAGLMEMAPAHAHGRSLGEAVPGDLAFTAPEYLLGEGGTTRSDQYALGALAYQMLTGRLPYGARAAQVRGPADRHKLAYDPVTQWRRDLPAWVDEALRCAVHPDPEQRHGDLDEFVHHLQHPSADFLARRRPPLIERHPVAFWRAVSLVLAAALVSSLALQVLGH